MSAVKPFLTPPLFSLARRKPARASITHIRSYWKCPFVPLNVPFSGPRFSPKNIFSAITGVNRPQLLPFVPVLGGIVNQPGGLQHSPFPLCLLLHASIAHFGPATCVSP